MACSSGSGAGSSRGPVRARHRAWRSRRAGACPASHPAAVGGKGRASGAGRPRRLRRATPDAWDPPGPRRQSGRPRAILCERGRPAAPRGWRRGRARAPLVRVARRAELLRQRGGRADLGGAGLRHEPVRPGAPAPGLGTRARLLCCQGRVPSWAARAGHKRAERSHPVTEQGRSAPQSAAPTPLSARTACCAGGPRARHERRHAALPLLRGRPARGAALRWPAARGTFFRVVWGRAPMRHCGGAQAAVSWGPALWCKASEQPLQCRQPCCRAAPRVAEVSLSRPACHQRARLAAGLICSAHALSANAGAPRRASTCGSTASVLPASATWLTTWWPSPATAAST